MFLSVIGSMEIFETKKFVMVGAWCRVEPGSNSVVEKVLET